MLCISNSKVAIVLPKYETCSYKFLPSLTTTSPLCLLQPALAESVSPLSPTPSPAGSVGSVGSGSASSGYCSLAHSVPAHAHQALLLLNKYYAFLYVAHDLWEQADSLCRLRANRGMCFFSVFCGLFHLFLSLCKHTK